MCMEEWGIELWWGKCDGELGQFHFPSEDEPFPIICSAFILAIWFGLWDLGLYKLDHTLYIKLQICFGLYVMRWGNVLFQYV